MLFNRYKLHGRFTLDPRTKILLLLSISLFVVSGGVAGSHAWVRSSTYLLAAMPLLLLGVGRTY